ncbi:M24 family metallopeptidase [Haloferax volcanii]|uniref:Xaa-Pro dipeptidase n=3 Tax=Haloferax volcanii TaxID=2246 RepID=D4GR44_HALVD|nr:Xaa-Pro peptidase family protein [Haloferax volcanii]ADE02189.1 putative Xaa-Pro dipeptidase [Haloferax volcanii DS2]ELY30772.1 Xaa-Pro aminopeptidase, M24 family protein [Haloferax volcanii DS2]MBS8120992.1 aminopeptidase P family protein [Haloferax volcanii]MBS8126029.1 aminopeptidase P family protein [Haloferax volcanii]MBS8129882.1 aminopeptidase P family protein [Haloferax volcanii]
MTTQRVAAAQERLTDVDADGLVLFPSVDMAYISGFTDEPMERHLFCFVGRDGDPIFVAPEMYDEQIRDTSHVTDVRTWADGDDPLAHVEDIADELGFRGGHLLVDDRMWARFTHDLRATLPHATFELASAVIEPLRLRKNADEQAALRTAAAVADRASVAVRELGVDAIGLTEAEFASRIESELTAHGGNGTSFDVIVGSGPNSAKPHHRHSDREIEAGDPVVLDFGTRVDGYPSDQTRTTVFAGDPPNKFTDIHATVCDALEAGVAAVEPGATAESVDAAARAVIENAGYSEAFIHRTGHGLGLEVHEPPYIVDGNDRKLEPGMVFSIEPGVYLDDEFGVRVEDIVIVTENGCERLNDSPRGWQSL